ncbi:MAG: class I SAM-dependent methyltransferase [Nocardioidaceae bacterium]
MYDDRGPDYPAEAVGWLVGTGRARVLEVAAGSGHLTKRLVDQGLDVVALEPSAQRLAALRDAVPAARRVQAAAEDIPMASSSVDVVIAGHAFHRFDHQRTLPEIARVLRPGGVLGLTWSHGDDKVPWVKRVLALMQPAADDQDDREVPADPVDPVAGSELFAPSELKVFRHWQQFHKDSLTEFAAANSRPESRTAADQAELMAAVGAIYDSFGRGPDGMLMPWKTYCYRSRVTGLADSQRQPPAGGLDDGLLIDFS